MWVFMVLFLGFVRFRSRSDSSVLAYGDVWVRSGCLWLVCNGVYGISAGVMLVSVFFLVTLLSVSD